MEPITMLLLALLVGAGATVVVTLTRDTVYGFIRTKAARSGTARIIRRRLESGQYEVVTGVFDASGSKIASQKWRAGAISDDLRQEFGGGNVITVTT